MCYEVTIRYTKSLIESKIILEVQVFMSMNRLLKLVFPSKKSKERLKIFCFQGQFISNRITIIPFQKDPEWFSEYAILKHILT